MPKALALLDGIALARARLFGGRVRAPTLALVGVLMAGTVEATPLRYEWTGNVSAVSGSFGEFFNELGIGSPFFVSVEGIVHQPASRSTSTHFIRTSSPPR